MSTSASDWPARWPDELNNDNWQYGTKLAYLKELVAYWRTAYDWRQHERAMNTFHHYRVTIDGQPIHFIHEPGRGPKPLPLILTHGWPWTFWDFHKVIRPLSDPVAFGGDAADAFDAVDRNASGRALRTDGRARTVGRRYPGVLPTASWVRS